MRYLSANNEKQCRRSLYKIDDPFFHMRFRVVAPHRALLASSKASMRLKLLRPWGPGSRWWQGNLLEWDVVAAAIEGKTLLGELKWARHRWGRQAVQRLAAAVAAKNAPTLGSHYAGDDSARVSFVPEVRDLKQRYVDGVLVVTHADF